MLLFPMALGIIPVPGLGRGRGRAGGIQTGLVSGAAEGGGELGSHLHLAACILPQLSSVGQRGDVLAAVTHGLHLYPSPIYELSLLCCWSGAISPVTCRRPGICRQEVISFIYPRSSFLSCELWVFSAPLLSKGAGARPVLVCWQDGNEVVHRPVGHRDPFPAFCKIQANGVMGPLGSKRGECRLRKRLYPAWSRGPDIASSRGFCRHEQPPRLILI